MSDMRVKVRGTEIKKNLLNDLKWVPISFGWCIFIWGATQVDNVYHENDATSKLYFFVEQLIECGRQCGVTYADLYNLLGGYMSVLLTVAGMIITGRINLSNRLEQTVHGIRRKELYSITRFGKAMADSYVGTFVAPAWMVYALIRKYCFTAYFILGMLFIQFLISTVLLAFTYSRERDYEKLRKKIFHSLKKVKKMKDFRAYDELLDQMHLSLSDTANWDELNRLFLDILYGIDEKEELLKVYKTCHDFLDRLYATKNSKRLIKLAISYTEELNAQNSLSNKYRWAYWSVLDCVYQNCSEEELDYYLDNLFQLLCIKGRRCDICSNLPVQDIEDIFNMIMLQTEYWLLSNNTRLCRFGKKMKVICKMANFIYMEERQEILRQCIGAHDILAGKYQSEISQCFERLIQKKLLDGKMLKHKCMVESLANM